MDQPLYIIKPSTRKNKRCVVVMEGMQHHFGSNQYENYTDQGNDKQKESYLARHKTREDWDKPRHPHQWILEPLVALESEFAC